MSTYFDNVGSKFHNFTCGKYLTAGDYHREFEKSLGMAKGTALIFLVLTTAIYQFLHHKDKDADTLFKTKPGQLIVLEDASITALFGLVTCMYVIVGRHGFSHLFTWGSIKTYLLIIVVLGLFAAAQEGSGLNRYLAKDEIKEHVGPYVTLNEAIIDPEAAVTDPFTDSTSYLLLILVAVIVIVYALNLFRIAMCGYHSKRFSITNSTFFGGALSPYVGFTIELVILGVLNAIPPFISPVIRGEKITSKSSIMAAITGFIALCLQFFLQYSGLLQ